jgi:hypothetical protein
LAIQLTNTYRERQSPDSHIEYALPHIRPWSVEAAALTAQWQAPDTSHERPFSMSSNAPLRACIGAASAGFTDEVVSDAPASPCASNS